MYKLRIAAQAQKELKKISLLHRQMILVALEDIKDDPLQGKILTKELTGRITYRIGVYRIIYKVNTKDRIVDIFTAGHRSIVYNN